MKKFFGRVYSINLRVDKSRKIWHQFILFLWYSGSQVPPELRGKKDDAFLNLDNRKSSKERKLQSLQTPNMDKKTNRIASSSVIGTHSQYLITNRYC